MSLTFIAASCVAIALIVGGLFMRFRSLAAERWTVIYENGKRRTFPGKIDAERHAFYRVINSSGDILLSVVTRESDRTIEFVKIDS